MKLTIDELIQHILSIANDIPFEYKGKEGYICPYYDNNIICCDMRLEDNIFYDIQNLDNIINCKFIDGKSLKEVCDEIIFF